MLFMCCQFSFCLLEFEDDLSHFGLGLSSLTVTCLLKTNIGISHQQRNKKSWETPQFLVRPRRIEDILFGLFTSIDSHVSVTSTGLIMLKLKTSDWGNLENHQNSGKFYSHIISGNTHILSQII